MAPNCLWFVLLFLSLFLAYFLCIFPDVGVQFTFFPVFFHAWLHGCMSVVLSLISIHCIYAYVYFTTFLSYLHMKFQLKSLLRTQKQTYMQPNTANRALAANLHRHHSFRYLYCRNVGAHAHTWATNCTMYTPLFTLYTGISTLNLTEFLLTLSSLVSALEPSV